MTGNDYNKKCLELLQKYHVYDILGKIHEHSNHFIDDVSKNEHSYNLFESFVDFMTHHNTSHAGLSGDSLKTILFNFSRVRPSAINYITRFFEKESNANLEDMYKLIKAYHHEVVDLRCRFFDSKVFSMVFQDVTRSQRNTKGMPAAQFLIGLSHSEKNLKDVIHDSLMATTDPVSIQYEDIDGMRKTAEIVQFPADEMPPTAHYGYTRWDIIDLTPYKKYGYSEFVWIPVSLVIGYSSGPFSMGMGGGDATTV